MALSRSQTIAILVVLDITFIILLGVFIGLLTACYTVIGQCVLSFFMFRTLNKKYIPWAIPPTVIYLVFIMCLLFVIPGVNTSNRYKNDTYRRTENFVQNVTCYYDEELMCYRGVTIFVAQSDASIQTTFKPLPDTECLDSLDNYIRKHLKIGDTITGYTHDYEYKTDRQYNSAHINFEFFVSYGVITGTSFIFLLSLAILSNYSCARNSDVI